MRGLENSSTGKNIIILMFLSFFLKGVGFVNRLAIAYYFGTNEYSDLYYIAVGFIDAISAVVVSSLSVGIVTIYIGKKNVPDRHAFVSSVVIAVAVIICCLVLLLFCFSDVCAYMLASHYDLLHIKRLSFILRVLAPALFFLGIQSVYAAVLQANHVFVPEKLVGTISSLIGIAAVIFFAKKYNEIALVISYITASIVNACFLLFCARRFFSFNFSLKDFFHNNDLKELGYASLPIFIGLATCEINLLIDKSVATSLEPGAVSALAYAGTLYLFVENIIINSVVTALFPDISKLYADSDHQSIASKTKNILFYTEVLLIPIVICSCMNAKGIVGLVYMHGNFDQSSLVMTSAALVGYIIGIPFLAVKNIITRLFYAYKDTRTPLYIDTVSVAINITLDFLLSRYIGIMGIALATAVSILFSSLMLYAVSIKRNELLRIYISIEKYCIGILGLFICCSISYTLNRLSDFLSIILSFIMTCFIEMLLVRILFVHRFYEMTSIIRYKLLKRK